jgi:hypothetical protein
MPTPDPLKALYHQPVMRDAEVMELLRIGERQLRNLIKAEKLDRVGPSTFHRISSRSLRRYLALPEGEPSSMNPWVEMFAERDCRKSSEAFGSLRQSTP